MQKNQVPKKFTPAQQIRLFILITLVLGISFIIFQPKVSAYLFPFVRQKKQIDFITQQNEIFDLNSYYEFRELSGGFGSWNFAYDQIDMTAILTSLPSNYQEQPILELAKFQAPYFQSQTLITDQETADAWLAQEATAHATVIKQGSDYTFFQNSDNSITLIFEKTGAEFLPNQGFFDLSNVPEEKAWLEARAWLEIAHF
ncbi:MAG: hypothetical protein Q4G02_03120 [bacterium]|nr:hypothetical protein [bacterium]